MIVYPAIDLKNGQVVRLRQGDPAQKTVYSDEPLTIAKKWQDSGAEWLHIVNLDGALDEESSNWPALEAIAGTGLSIQFGGGLRSAADVERALNNGVKRAILGTVAVENPALVEALLAQHGAESIVVALDARGGKVATHGWQTESEWTAADLGKAMAERGVRHALYTDIARDGELEGVNVAATRELARETGLLVIASGGVRSLDDVKALRGGDVAGVILGKALYEGLIDLATALHIAQSDGDG